MNTTPLYVLYELYELYVLYVLYERERCRKKSAPRCSAKARTPRPFSRLGRRQQGGQGGALVLDRTGARECVARCVPSPLVSYETVFLRWHLGVRAFFYFVEQPEE